MSKTTEPIQDSSLLWSTYRPNLYFGLRPCLPRPTLLYGLLWYSTPSTKVELENVRHECCQRPGLKYGFIEHDPRGGCKQVVEDEACGVRMEMGFAKMLEGRDGGVWGVRIEGTPLKGGGNGRIELVNYFGKDSKEGSLELVKGDEEKGKDLLMLRGDMPGLGTFEISVRAADSQKFPMQVYGTKVNSGDVWKAKETLVDLMNSNSSGPKIDPEANLFAVHTTLEGNWSIDISFGAPNSSSGIMNSSALTSALVSASERFHARFESAFHLSDHFDSSEIAFAESTLANLLGGIGYFYGTSIVDQYFKYPWDREDHDKDQEAHPETVAARCLLTATPCRSFFPRGFYWDEGFHLLLIGRWDLDLGLEIIKSWVDLIDEDGWVGREQILGDEARSRVPSAYVAQFPAYANPPTLVMAIQASIARVREASASETSDPSTHAKARTFLTSIYPKLKLHYEWFRRTQRGQIAEYGRSAKYPAEAYRWRGQTVDPDQLLTSGLDDYPRAEPPTRGDLHVDLICWMAAFADTMKGLAAVVGEEEDRQRFEEEAEAVKGNIDDLHWSEQEQMYLDATTDSNGKSKFVVVRGYVALFPFLLALIDPSSPKLGATLDLLRDPTHLWSDFGIRSLSPSEHYYGKDEDYWRGPIWIPMNYMALATLHKTYAKQPGPYQARAARIYTELRQNLINNMHKEYERTGFIFEQYHGETGKGQRSYPFTGWSALIVLSELPMSEQSVADPTLSRKPDRADFSAVMAEQY